LRPGPARSRPTVAAYPPAVAPLTRFLQHSRRPQLPQEWCEEAPESGHDPRAGEGLSRDVERALQALSENQRLAVVHCLHLDRSHAETAQVLGLPLVTPKSHLDRTNLHVVQAERFVSMLQGLTQSRSGILGSSPWCVAGYA
jgi:hypothetical protein